MANGHAKAGTYTPAAAELYLGAIARLRERDRQIALADARAAQLPPEEFMRYLNSLKD